MFIERISEVTEVFERERDFRAASEAVSSDAGVADISGYTDYGRVWTEFLALIEDELHPRATVIVLGDARTNGRPPRDDVFAAITAKAGRTFWLNPEPRLYWNYGDSVIAAYEKHCTRVRVLAHRPARGVRQGADEADRGLLAAHATGLARCARIGAWGGARRAISPFCDEMGPRGCSWRRRHLAVVHAQHRGTAGWVRTGGLRGSSGLASRLWAAGFCW